MTQGFDLVQKDGKIGPDAKSSKQNWVRRPKIRTHGSFRRLVHVATQARQES